MVTEITPKSALVDSEYDFIPGEQFGSYLRRLPEYKLTVVVLLNCVPQLHRLQRWGLAGEIACLALGLALPLHREPKVAAYLWKSRT